MRVLLHTLEKIQDDLSHRKVKIVNYKTSRKGADVVLTLDVVNATSNKRLKITLLNPRTNQSDFSLDGDVYLTDAVVSGFSNRYNQPTFYATIIQLSRVNAHGQTQSITVETGASK